MSPTIPNLLGFQVTAANFLADRQAAFLADEMGLGKTVEAIGALSVLDSRNQLRRALVVAPGYLTSNWQAEFERWSPRTWVETVRGDKSRRMGIWRSEASVILASYDTLTSDAAIAGARPFDVVIFDEAQKVKSRTSKVHGAAMELRSFRKWALSGTPIENAFDEYKSIFEVIDPALLSPESDLEPWRQRELMAEKTLRRTRRDVLDLPPFVEQQVWLELGNAQRKQYDALIGQTLKTLREHPTTAHVLAMLSKLLQCCSVDPETGESTKLEYLDSALQDVKRSGGAALVFSCLPNKVLTRIAPRLGWCNPIMITGETPPDERARLVRQFQEEKGFAVALMSTKAGGLGLNMTNANYIFHFDHWWTPAAKQQADARAYRLGQGRTVFSYSLFCSGTVEETVAKLLREKHQLFLRVLNGAGEGVDESTTKQLLQIIEGLRN